MSYGDLIVGGALLILAVFFVIYTIITIQDSNTRLYKKIIWSIISIAWFIFLIFIFANVPMLLFATILVIIFLAVKIFGDIRKEKKAKKNNSSNTNQNNDSL